MPLAGVAIINFGVDLRTGNQGYYYDCATLQQQTEGLALLLQKYAIKVAAVYIHS